MYQHRRRRTESSRAVLCAVAMGLGACTTQGAPAGIYKPDADRFAAEVYPILLRDCAMSECHGDAHRFFDVVGPGRTRLDARTDALAAATADEIRETYDRACSMLAPPPHVDRSLLLRKPLALDAGGATHQGSDKFGRNVYWSRTDPAYATIARWVLEEPSEAAP